MTTISDELLGRLEEAVTYTNAHFTVADESWVGHMRAPEFWESLPALIAEVKRVRGVRPSPAAPEQPTSCAKHGAGDWSPLGYCVLCAAGVGASPAAPEVIKLADALKTYGHHRVGCPHPHCPDCGTHTMAASKTPGYSYCTRCGKGSIPTTNEACDCGFEAALEVAAGAALGAAQAPERTEP